MPLFSYVGLALICTSIIRRPPVIALIRRLFLIFWDPLATTVVAGVKWSMLTTVRHKARGKIFWIVNLHFYDYL